MERWLAAMLVGRVASSRQIGRYLVEAKLNQPLRSRVLQLTAQSASLTQLSGSAITLKQAFASVLHIAVGVALNSLWCKTNLRPAPQPKTAPLCSAWRGYQSPDTNVNVRFTVSGVTGGNEFDWISRQDYFANQSVS